MAGSDSLGLKGQFILSNIEVPLKCTRANSFKVEQ